MGTLTALGINYPIFNHLDTMPATMYKGGAPLKKPNMDRYPTPFSFALDRKGAGGDGPAIGGATCILISINIHEERPTPRFKGYIVWNRKLCSKLLSLLGQSSLSQNVNQLTKAPNSGFLPTTQDIDRALRKAAAPIQHMRVTLNGAIGLKTHGNESDCWKAPRPFKAIHRVCLRQIIPHQQRNHGRQHRHHPLKQVV